MYNLKSIISTCISIIFLTIFSFTNAKSISFKDIRIALNNNSKELIKITIVLLTTLLTIFLLYLRAKYCESTLRINKNKLTTDLIEDVGVTVAKMISQVNIKTLNQLFHQLYFVYYLTNSNKQRKYAEKQKLKVFMDEANENNLTLKKEKIKIIKNILAQLTNFLSNKVKGEAAMYKYYSVMANSYIAKCVS